MATMTVWSFRWTLSAILAAALVSPATAAAEGERAKVGDRVENAPMYGERGTIQEVGTGDRRDCYLVLPDAYKGTGKKGSWVCTHGRKGTLFLIDAAGKRVRDVNAAGDAADPGPASPTPAPQRTDLPTRPPDGRPIAGGQKPALCGGELLLKPRTRGRSASPELFSDIIKSLSDKEHDPGKESGRRVTTIRSLVVGASYRWRPDHDFQMLGTQPKTVHPVAVRYASCTEGLLEYKLAESTSDETYSCYLSEASGDWTCSLKTSGEFKRTYVQK